MNATARVSAIAPSAPADKGCPPAWVETPTAKRINAALNYAQAVTDIAIVYGGTGTGKTWTANHYRSNGMNVWCATMTPATSGVVPALEEVCAALGLPRANGAAPLHRAIVTHLSGTSGLLIIDEAQHMTPAALDQIRGIHDAARVGLALLGSQAIYASLIGGESAGTLERLRSRIGKQLGLQGATQGDVEAIAFAWGISSKGSVKLLVDISGKAGGLRGVVKALRLAAMQADAVGRAVNEADLKAAWRELGIR